MREPWKTLTIGLLFPALVLPGAWLGADVGGTVGAQIGMALGFFFALVAAFLWR